MTADPFPFEAGDAEPARAKINLCLHVTGRRPSDGYHLIESLAVFADEAASDRVSCAPSSDDSFSVTGPFTDSLGADTNDNLVTRARDWLRERVTIKGQPAAPVALTLEKQLPVASGIGGGSADAAAALRLLARHWALNGAIDPAGTAALGADVPMCLVSLPVIARGIGDELALVSSLPEVPVLLVNPGMAVSTPAAFGMLEERENPPMPVLPHAGFDDAKDLAQWLKAQTRNDLAPAAVELVPKISSVLASLEQQGALLARVSGSGATCFGLFESRQAAQQATSAIATAEPEWWVKHTMLNAASARQNEEPADAAFG